MARQFYTIAVQSATTPVIIHFDKPVRKIRVAVLSNYIAVSVGTEIDTDRMMIFSVYNNGLIDFQSANTGKGVQDLACWRFGGEGAARLAISVVEYGSDGDNEFFIRGDKT